MNEIYEVYKINDVQKKILDERMKQRIKGKDKCYEWKNVHDNIRRKK